jgi:proline racemase
MFDLRLARLIKRRSVLHCSRLAAPVQHAAVISGDHHPRPQEGDVVRDPLAEIAWKPARPVLTVVGCHAGGEIGNVVVAGVPPPPGETVFEQMQAIAADDSIRHLLLREPRGSVAVHSNVILPATRLDCPFGYVIMEPTEYPAMSGSNTICVATVLLETGMVEMVEPVTTLRLEAPGGPIDITAGCRDGKVEWVELENVPCFADRLDAPLEVEGLGTLTVDVAYGGMWYAIADAGALGFELTPAEARDLSRVGELIRAAAREQLPVVHPENADIAGVSIVQIAEPWQGIGRVSKNAVVVAPGRLDRSATGTGLSARLAALHARGRMHVGHSMTHASVIGSTFEGRIVREVDVAGRMAIVPAIKGSAWITGVTQVVVDPTDPFPKGYILSDTWPGADVQA